MNRLIFALLCLLTAVTVSGTPINAEEAAIIARQFLTQRHAGARHHAPARQQLHAVNDKATAYHVFNIGSGDGFVIVSADDACTPILGWSDEGTFSPDSLPDNMREWLRSCSDELQWLRQQGVAPTMPAEGQSLSPVKEAIAPMLTTRWNQNAPYNLLCPYFLNDTNRNRCATGCVATAMAQTLAYSRNRPVGTMADISAYYCNTKWGTNGQQVYVEAKPKTTFNWDLMLDSYTADATDAQQQAVAKLMAYCGASVQVDYKDGTSSASQSRVAPALHDIFGMQGTQLSRKDYSYAQWTNLIYAEMRAGRPVIYDGRATGGGHAFVVDGFDGGELFHVNWGWGGKNDGYFALSVMHPADNSGIGASPSNDGYSYQQTAIVGIQPGYVPQDAAVQMSLNDISVSDNTVTFAMYNFSGAENTFDIGVGIVDDDGNISHVITVLDNHTFQVNYGRKTLRATIDGSGLTPGTYRYVTTSKLSSSDRWLTDMPYHHSYIEATVAADGRVTLRLMPVAPLLTAEALTWPEGHLFAGHEVNIRTRVHNGGGEFCGALYLFVSQSSDKGDYESRLGMTIGSGATAEASFTFTPDKEGTWHLWLATDADGNDVLATADMTVSELNYTKPGYLEVTKVSFVSPIDEDSWALSADGTQRVDVISNTLQLKPSLRNTSNTTLTGKWTVYLKLQKQQDNGQWTDVKSFRYTFTDFKAGTGYNLTSGGLGYVDFGQVGYGLFRLAVYLEDALQDARYQMNLTSGYHEWASDGMRNIVKSTSERVSVSQDAVAIDLSSYDFSSITPNSNPNTLYILGPGQTVPAALKDRNVVQDGRAASISLTDGYSFFSPTDFTAGQISYRRTFSNGYTKTLQGWNTLALPFTPTAVTAGGTAVDWQRTATDSGKAFYVMELVGDDDGDAYFDYAAQMVPYRPYLVAVPGEGNAQKSLVGQELVFSASNSQVPATYTGARSAYSMTFYGTTTVTASLDRIYTVNATGDAFIPSSGRVKPFRAYFTALEEAPEHIGIGFVSLQPAGISTIHADSTDVRSGVYTLSGLRTDDGTGQLPPGIYIINGKKRVVRGER